MKDETKWIEKTVECENPFFRRRWYCPECGEWQTYGETPYCMYCGADLRKEEAE